MNTAAYLKVMDVFYFILSFFSFHFNFVGYCFWFDHALFTEKPRCPAQSIYSLGTYRDKDRSQPRTTAAKSKDAWNHQAHQHQCTSTRETQSRAQYINTFCTCSNDTNSQYGDQPQPSIGYTWYAQAFCTCSNNANSQYRDQPQPSIDYTCYVERHSYQCNCKGKYITLSFFIFVML